MDSYWLNFGFQDLYQWSFNHQKFNGAEEEIVSFVTGQQINATQVILTSDFQTLDLRHLISEFWVLFPTINSWFSHLHLHTPNF